MSACKYERHAGSHHRGILSQTSAMTGSTLKKHPNMPQRKWFHHYLCIHSLSLIMFNHYLSITNSIVNLSTCIESAVARNPRNAIHDAQSAKPFVHPQKNNSERREQHFGLVGVSRKIDASGRMTCKHLHSKWLLSGELGQTNQVPVANHVSQKRSWV